MFGDARKQCNKACAHVVGVGSVCFTERWTFSWKSETRDFDFFMKKFISNDKITTAYLLRFITLFTSVQKKIGRKYSFSTDLWTFFDQKLASETCKIAFSIKIKCLKYYNFHQKRAIELSFRQVAVLMGSANW